MKLGLMTGYWGAGPPDGVADALAAAEELGFDSAWTSEAYGSDALTPLAWWGARTERIRLGTAIIQMSARTPAATAMAAISMDHLTGGRFILGLGVSGPQVVEGWYGQPYPKPLSRTREYVEIVRRILAREGPVTFSGEYYELPLDGGTGLGKALKSTVHPLRNDLPIFIGAEGPKNIALSAEIAEGWLPFWFSPKSDAFYRAALAEGFGRPNARSTAESFEVACAVPIVPGPDVEAAADWVRPHIALYVGGMGAKSANFHYQVFVRMGWEAECAKIQELYMSGNKQEAIAAVPTEMVEDVALVGPPEKIKEELDLWRSTVITTLLVTGDASMVRMIAELAG